MHQILDAGLFCTIAYIKDQVPFQIPTGYVRIDDFIFIHGSAKSHFISSIIGSKVSFSVTLLDGLVLSPTRLTIPLIIGLSLVFLSLKK